MTELLRDHYDAEVPLPAILLFDTTLSLDTPGQTTVNAVAYSLQGFTGPGRIVTALTELAARAGQAQERGLSATALGARA